MSKEDTRGLHAAYVQSLLAENHRLRSRLAEAEANDASMPNLDPEPVDYADGAFESGLPVREWVYDAATNTLGPPRP